MLIQSEHNGHYLTFSEEEHAYQLDGKLIPGVTSILHEGLPTSPSLISWTVKTGSQYVVEQLKQFPEQVNRLPEYLLEEIIKKSTTAGKRKAKEAADVGSVVHDWAEQYESKEGVDFSLIRKIDEHPDKEKIQNCINRFCEWKETNSDEIIGHEEIVASVAHQFGGKFDRLCRRGNRVILSDYKTSGSIYSNYFIQLAAYSLALEEWKGIEVDGLEILRFGKTDAEFETKLVKGKRKIQELKKQFIRCAETYRFMREWK